MKSHWLNHFGFYTERQVWDLEDTLTARIDAADEVRITKRDIARIRAVCALAEALPPNAPAVVLRRTVGCQYDLLGLILRKHEWRKAGASAVMAARVRRQPRDPAGQFIKGGDA